MAPLVLLLLPLPVVTVVEPPLPLDDPVEVTPTGNEEARGGDEYGDGPTLSLLLLLLLLLGVPVVPASILGIPVVREEDSARLLLARLPADEEAGG